jgi:hypothetical protein
MKKMDSDVNEIRKQSRPSPGRINTVVEFLASESDEMDDEDSSRNTPLPSMLGTACVRAPEKPVSPTRPTNAPAKAIAIELKVTTNQSGERGVIETNAGEPQEGFFSGPVSLLTKADLMNMIQEGVRLGISDVAKNNRIKVLRKTHTSTNAATASSSSSAVQPSGKTMKYILHQYKPKSFQILRKLCDISTESFISSICNQELIGGFTEASGKSGSIFWYSSDRKYIMKSITPQESHLLQQICSSYTRYIGTHPHTLLCRILGMYKIETTVAMPSLLRGPTRASRVRSNAVLTTRFVIMKNIFSSSPPSGMDKFDLKGTTEDRYVRRVTGNEVLKDINFQNRWISLPDSLSDCLTRVIEEDSEFLLRHGIMDYSFIVGVSTAKTGEAAQQLCNEAEGYAVETVVKGGSEVPLNMKEKLNAQLARAAISMQKLFKPPRSRGGSVHDSDDERDPEDEPPTAIELRKRASARAVIRSVFTSFNEGVVGIDEKGESPVIYYFGIIDILQQYTAKKKAAHLIKRCTIGCCHEIDTVAPSYYRSRFVRYLQGKVQSVDSARLEAVAASARLSNSP